MGLFTGLKKDAEPSNKETIAAENRQMSNVREQMALGAATNPEEDQMYAVDLERRTDFLKWQQQLGDDLLKLVMTLKGYAVGEGGTWIKKTKKALCNDKFIYEVIIPQCEPFFGKNLINSNLTEEQISMMLKNTMNEIVDVMADAWEQTESSYAIEFTDHDLILRLIKNAIVPAPYRALKGWTKKLDNTATRRIEAFSESPDKQQKKGWKIFE